jgi:hypothetical protein
MRSKKYGDFEIDSDGNIISIYHGLYICPANELNKLKKALDYAISQLNKQENKK